jgi:hypothetical protein
MLKVHIDLNFFLSWGHNPPAFAGAAGNLKYIHVIPVDFCSYRARVVMF